MSDNILVNSGAVYALRGYRTQFLYCLYRILFFQEPERYFRLEGSYEDLDIYDQGDTVREVVQIKDVKGLSLSSLLDFKETSFLKRAVRSHKTDLPLIHLVSFQKVSPEIEELGRSAYSSRLIQKMKKQGLKDSEIEGLRANFRCTILSKEEVEKQVKQKLSDTGLFADLDTSAELLVFWMYLSAERQELIDRQKIVEKFAIVGNYLSQRENFTKHMGTLIRPLERQVKNLDTVGLRSDFYQGISATYSHILADVDVKREEKLHELHTKFGHSRITFIHGASGQGKSTLAYRYLRDYCTEIAGFEIFLVEDAGVIAEIITVLESISAGMLVPVVVYLDIVPGNSQWMKLLQVLAVKNNLKFLVTIREEDWKAMYVRDKFEFSEIELEFNEGEGRMIYDALNAYQEDLKFIDFEEAWKKFGEKGPLLEFVYMITQYQTLPEKLKEQIARIQEKAFSDGMAGLELKLLRYVCIADSNGAMVDYKAIAAYLECEEMALVVSRLTKEYLLQLTGDQKYITGLHPVRSRILQDILFDEEIVLKSDYALELFGKIREDTYAGYIRNICRYIGVDIQRVLSRLRETELNSWAGYASVTDALLWKGVDDYICENKKVLQQAYDRFKSGWKLFVHFDFSDILQGKSIVENSGLFPPEAIAFSQQIDNSLTDKRVVFQYLLDWYKMLSVIPLHPDKHREWEVYVVFCFWMDFLQIKSIRIGISDYGQVFNNMSVQLGAKVLYVLKKQNFLDREIIRQYEELWKKRVILEYNVFHFEFDQKEKSVKVHYLYDITGEKNYDTSGNQLNAKVVFLIDMMRYAFCEMEIFASQGYGHKFSFLPEDFDESVKHISKKNLPLEPLVGLNVLLINRFEYDNRPATWKEYVSLILKERLRIIEALNLLVAAFAQFYRQNDYRVLLHYLQTYEGKYPSGFVNQEETYFPKVISDEWGYVSENKVKKRTKNTVEIEKYILSVEKYRKYQKLYQDYRRATENFIQQSASVIFKRCQEKAGNQVEDYASEMHISLVANLFEAYKVVFDFQEEFRIFFKKYTSESELNYIEVQERKDIASLCFLWQHFCYTKSTLQGDVVKLAQQRLSDSKRSFENKLVKAIRNFEREEDLKITICLEEKWKKIFILVDSDSYVRNQQALEKLYVLFREVIDQPAYTTIKYLVLETYYPDFCVILLFHRKAPLSKMFEFSLLKLMATPWEELKSIDLIAQDLPVEIEAHLGISDWSKEGEEAERLICMLDSAGTCPVLASGLKQLFELSDKEVDDAGVEVIKNQVNKLGERFKQCLQSLLDCFRYYAPVIQSNEWMTEKELDELMNLYAPSREEAQKLFSGRLILNAEVMKRWTPKLEELRNHVSVLYLFLFDLLIKDGEYKGFE